MVVLGDEVERTTGMLAGMRKIALRQSESGMMHGDGSRQTLEFLFVDDYRSSGAQSSSASRKCGATSSKWPFESSAAA